MAKIQSPVPADAAEHIIESALAAFARGAGRVPIAAPAASSFRDQFLPRVHAALEQADWHDVWQREEVYVLAVAEAMGERARRLAADDRRTYITPQDVGEAMRKIRGFMPIAGRWCPL
jgi:hypothetical protein